MSKDKIWEVIIIWQWHLASRLKKKFSENNINIKYIQSRNFLSDSDNLDISNFEKIKNQIKEHKLSTHTPVCILDDEDDYNIQLALIVLSINKNIPIYISLFNKWLWEQLKNIWNNITIVNPAKIAAPYFVNKFKDYAIINKNKKFKKIKRKKHKDKSIFNSLLFRVFLVFCFIYLGWILFFKYNENLSWIDSIYFCTVTVATVWYWDISLKASSTETKAFAILFMLASMFTIYIFFSLLIDSMMKKRYEKELGRKRYNMKNHIVICWLWRIWYEMVDELDKKWKEMIIIEEDMNGRFLEVFKKKNIKTFIWDATIVDNLLDVWIHNAESVYLMINNDIKNLEIWLIIKQLNPEIPIIMRIYDESLAETIRDQFNLPYAFSTTSFAADYIYNMISDTN